MYHDSLDREAPDQLPTSSSQIQHYTESVLAPIFHSLAPTLEFHILLISQQFYSILSLMCSLYILLLFPTNTLFLTPQLDVYGSPKVDTANCFSKSLLCFVSFSFSVSLSFPSSLHPNTPIDIKPTHVYIYTEHTHILCLERKKPESGEGERDGAEREREGL